MTRLNSLPGLLIALQIPVFAGAPAFEFFTRHDLTDESDATTAVVSADFNRDGIADLASAGSAGISVFLGTGGGRFGLPTTISILQGSNPYVNLAVADINSDGIPDLLLFDGYNVGRTLFGKGDGTFVIGPEFNESPTNAVNQIFTADFNLDGKPDLALGSEQGINILLGHGDGTFSTPHLLPVFGNLCIAVGDFNGDGIPDAAACGSNVEVFLGNGDGTFQAPLESATPSPPAFLSPGDLNGDGNLDLAAVAYHFNGYNPSLGPLYVLFGNGDGTFAPTIQVHTDIGPLQAVAIGDLSGDGVADIVALGLGGLVASILNKGAGVFQLDAAVPITFGATYNDTIILADLKGDHFPDIVTSNSGGFYFSVLFNVRGERFQDLVTVAVPGFPAAAGISNSNITPLAKADFNHDGQEDVAFLVGNQALQAFLGVYLGTGSASHPFVKGPLTSVPYGTNSIVEGDFNNDGVPDIAICVCAYSDPGSLIVYLGNGDGTFEPGAGIAITSAEYMIARDFNNDGNADIALSSGTLLLGHGDGTFAAEMRFYNGGNAGLGEWLGAADFNHDGKMDIAFFVPEAGFLPYLNVFLGNGDGTFQPPALYSAGGDPVWGDIADFNGDGIPDIVIWNSSGGGIKPQNAAAVLLGNGDGSFAQPTFVQGHKMVFPNMIIARDLDGDGYVDLAVMDSGDYNGFLGGGNSVVLFPGNGDGTFGTQQAIPGAQGMSVLATGFFHGEKSAGFPDVLMFDSLANTFAPLGEPVSAISVLLNRGAHN